MLGKMLIMHHICKVNFLSSWDDHSVDRVETLYKKRIRNKITLIKITLQVDTASAVHRDTESDLNPPNGGTGTEKSKPRTPIVSPTTAAAAVTRKLTSQVVSRQPPLITNPQLHRQFLLKLSKIPWTEQIKIKASFDGTINPKKVRKVEKHSENNFKHPTMPTKLDLKQVGKSVKYSKGRLKNSQPAVKSAPFALVLGTLSGEWEAEHSFVCSVCGIEYDDVLEIMHHKWEVHPHCLVTHVSLKHNLQRPPSLLYPQVKLLAGLVIKIGYKRQYMMDDTRWPSIVW